MSARILEHPDYKVAYYDFSKRPLSDSCWSTQAGPDGRIYIASCVEHTGGESATVVRYRESDDSLEYLMEMDEVTGDLRDSGRATQCKIHYSFVPDSENGLMYCATHLSGPPKGESHYNPWSSWNDPGKAFRGSYLVSYDTVRDEVADSRIMIPREGCRCLCLDTRLRRLYAVSYPRDHFVWYDLARKELHDLGRLGSVNTQCLFSDRFGRIYTFIDTGRMIRYSPEKDKIEELPWTFPHEHCQTPWHGVIYDAVAEKDSGAVYMVPWRSRPHLARFWPEDGPCGRLEDLGLLSSPRPPDSIASVNVEHIGGLVFGRDGKLHYVKADMGLGFLCRMDTRTLEHETLCTLQGGRGWTHYVARAAADPAGNLYMGKIGCAKPCGFYRIRVGENVRNTPSKFDFIRLWG